MTPLEQLRDLLLQKALRFGDFTLASGQKSTYYINCKPVTLGALGSYLVGKTMLDLISKDCVSIGGLTLGADPIVSSITVVSHLENRPVDGFLVRKEQKGHGTGNQIENAPSSGSKVIIVDDVITTGGSALQAAKVAQDSGLEVVKAISIVDRQGGGEEAFNEIGVPMEALFTITELLDYHKSQQ